MVRNDASFPAPEVQKLAIYVNYLDKFVAGGPDAGKNSVAV